MFTAKLKKKKKEKEKESKESIFFQKNGAAILEQIVICFNGNCNLIRRYSIEELNKATNNFSLEGIIHRDVDLTVYEAVHEDGRVLVKEFVKSFRSDLADIANEVAIASQMSKHKNVLKLLGCCLDTELPILVYEFPVNGNLRDYCRCRERKALLPWETKLRIATDIANAVAYLHHGFSKTFIHRDLSPFKIFLDQDYVAKLSDFRISIPIPEGKTHVDSDPIIGTLGYMALEVAMEGRFTERSDVYAFGILFCVLLTQMSLGELMIKEQDDHDDDDASLHSKDEELSGSSYIIICSWTDPFIRICKAQVLQQGNEKQVMECFKLIERCLTKNTEDRPDMIEVAKALRFIKNIK